ncbi:MAG: MFS transporter [Acidobacteria bacterium]|nr:MFS transporter [Acidobacteriota bacterium]
MTPAAGGLAPWAIVGFLWVCYMLNHADRQVAYTLLPSLQKDFQLSDQILGLVGALFLWVYGLSSPISGIVGDRFPKRKLIVGSVFVWSGFTLLSGFAPTGAFLLSCRALLGLSESMFFPAAAAMLGNAHGPATRSKAIAIFATSQLVGVAFGGSISGYIAEQSSWRASFWVLGAAGIIFALPLWIFLSRLPDHLRMDKPEAGGASWGEFFQLFTIPSLRVVTLYVTVATFSLFLVYSWLATYLHDRFGLSLSQAGVEASLYPQIGNALGLLLGGALADRLTRRTHAARFWVIMTGLFLAAPAIYWLGSTTTVLETRFAAMTFTFFHGFIVANQVASAYDVVPPSLRASTVGVLNFIGATIAGFGPFLGGLARRTIGVDQLLQITAILLAAAGCVTIYAIRRMVDRDRRYATGELTLTPRGGTPQTLAQGH